jgi:NADPH-dependent 2,4-dienoyl-CoA reductase/sulfur reductase-like enzyme
VSRRLADAADLPARVDVAVVGAGPAGLSAATRVAAGGLDVLLLDEMANLGGRFHRAVLERSAAVDRIVGADAEAGRRLAEDLLAAPLGLALSATVWSLKPRPAGDGHRLELAVSIAGRARLVAARAVIVATGARERPMPFPGWTLPGVMTAGAAQMALKEFGLVPEGRLALAGSGPLLLLVADQLRAAGAEVALLLDTTPPANLLAALPRLPGFLASPLAADGLRLAGRLVRRTRVVGAVGRLAATAIGDRLRLDWRGGFGGGTAEVDHLFVHQGVLPEIGLIEAAGAETVWQAADRAFRPRLDDFGRTTLPGLAVAGDGGGIAGAAAAVSSGRLAALGVLADLGGAGADAAEIAGIRRDLARARAGRGFVERLWRPAAAFLAPPDDATIVCRCEEATAGDVRRAVDHGAPGPNQLKLHGRCGMGPCQGRMCGPTLTELIAARRGVPPGEVGGLRARTPVRPVSLAEWASLPLDDAARAAVAGSGEAEEAPLGSSGG